MCMLIHWLEKLHSNAVKTAPSVCDSEMFFPEKKAYNLRPEKNWLVKTSRRQDKFQMENGKIKCVLYRRKYIV